MSDIAKVEDKQGTFTIYDAQQNCVGRVCTDTGRAMIGSEFYVKERVCADESTDFDRFVCGECGATMVVNEDARPTLFSAHKQDALEPKFCPACGARILDV